MPNDEKSSIDVEMQEETGQREINYGSESEDLELEEKPTTELPNNKVYDIGDDIFGNCEKKYMNNRETAEYCLGVVKELSEDVKFNILINHFRPVSDYKFHKKPNGGCLRSCMNSYIDAIFCKFKV